ncbi:kielin/chordin-like protein isoform X2 [Cephus cinctus]|uniref:Kielin/chordin-like protein isoform X2 n=1 Tax=Cephus cinctus TaxID=211228 RepID=A0AAJ7FQY9_CEPCN|nr:kielin/chordin-like protein isoform X2 [Cephus cinctus]
MQDSSMCFNVNISQTMDGHGRINLLLQLFFCFVVFASSEETKQNCSQVQCPGPLMYYKDVGCTPVYKNEGDCCAYKYNCDHLNARSPNKCYINNSSYNIGESLREEDANPCDIGCSCRDGRNSAHFTCAIVDCFFGPVQPGCYRKRNVTECCPGPVICPEDKSEIPMCVVDGVTYRDGEFFTPKNEPEKSCTCQEGYTGQNIEPFCITPSTICGTDLHHNEDIAERCIPTYYATQNPATSCSVAWRCQNSNDTVISYKSKSASPEGDSSGEKGMTCTFGNLTMNVGDELNQGTDYSSVCVKCVCEIPPTPTCQRLDDNECDVTNHSLGGK